MYLQTIASLDMSEQGAMCSTTVDLQGYQDTLESVLTWLLEAENLLHKQGELAQDVQNVKDQFHEHEV